MGLPMFRPFLYCINNQLGDVRREIDHCDVVLSASDNCKCFVHVVLNTYKAKCSGCKRLV
jgi:hypothetical protein